MTRLSTAAILAMASLIAACSDPPEPVPEHSADPQEIAWFDGTYDEAVEFAATEGKPLLLYWGAEWCPPCHYLKTKVFHKPEFVAATRNVVPVYLDGDTERAQTLGEKLGVAGYPTVILYSPGGQEITRLPTGVAAEVYAAQLERAVHSTRPMADVLSGVLATGPAEAARSDLRLLAFHSWDQDASLTEDSATTLATLGTLWRETPEELASERARFLAAYISHLVRAEPPVEPDEDERAAMEQGVRAVLTDPTSRDAAMEFVLFGAGDTVGLLHPKSGEGRDALVALWLTTTRAIGADESQAMDDRLGAMVTELELSSTDEPDDALKGQVAARVAWADSSITDDSELQAVMSTMVYLLEQIDRPEAAEELIVRRLDDTHAPYYFMSWLASLREDAGDIPGAMDWYRKAYDASRGRYSRFRWGSLLVRRQVELMPNDVAAIEAVSEEVLTEVLSFPDAFSLGNHSRLQQMEKALTDWSEETGGAETLERLHGLVSAACDRFPPDSEDSQRERCEAVFAS